MKLAERPLPHFFSSRVRGKLPLLLALPGLLIIAVFLLCCGQEQEIRFEGGSFILSPEDMQGFTVVRSDSASDLVVRESLRICQTISDATGRKVDLVTDWERQNAPGKEGSALPAGGSEGSEGLELLVGLTSRAESTSLLSELAEGDHFLLRTIGRKILIASTSETLLTDAVDKFLTDFVRVEGNEVHIARKIDYRSENYAYFCLARGGKSRCCFLLPKTASGTLTSAVKFIAQELESCYGVSIPIRKASSLDDAAAEYPEGVIVVGRSDCALCRDRITAPPESVGEAKFFEKNLFLSGTTDESTVAALSEFYATLRTCPDTDCSGLPYVRLPRDLSLSCTWEFPDVPFLLGAHKKEEISISSRDVQILFDGASSSISENYTRLLEEKGFTVFWLTAGKNYSFSAENALFRIRAEFSSTGPATVNISSKY